MIPVFLLVIAAYFLALAGRGKGRCAFVDVVGWESACVDIGLDSDGMVVMHQRCLY